MFLTVRTTIENHLSAVGFLLMSLCMGALHRRLSSSGTLLVVLLCLPFTLMHEIAHYTVALVTGGQPTTCRIIPKRVSNGWILGCVQSVPTFLSAVPTAIAPLGWLVVGYYSFLYWDNRPAWLPEYIIIPIIYACAAACTPSLQDIKVALAHPLSLLLWCGVSYAVYSLSSQF